MKAERRHELKENDLVHALNVARDYLDHNGKGIAIAVIVVGAAFATVAFTVRSRAAAVEDVWRRKAALLYGDPEEGRQSIETLFSITQGVTDDRFVFDSLVDQGREGLRLAQAVPAPPDVDLNRKARRAWEGLLETFPDNPLAFGLAHSGLSTVEENEFAIDGDRVHRERSEIHLREIMDHPAMSGLPFQKLALDRLDALDRIFTIVTFESPPEEPDPAALTSPAIDLIQVDPADLSTLPPVSPPAEESGESNSETAKPKTGN